jgi:hypothetical protein
VRSGFTLGRKPNHLAALQKRAYSIRARPQVGCAGLERRAMLGVPFSGNNGFGFSTAQMQSNLVS